MKENSKNNQLRELYDNVMLPNYSPASFIPERAEGSRLWDKDNKEYIDFGGGIAVNSLGHSHPDLIEALAVQSKKLWHLSNYLTNQPAIELAERLTKNTFAENVFFSNSGSEANETAIKIARKFFSTKGEKRDQIVSFKNSFHGRSLLNISLGSSKVHRNGFEPLMPGIAHGNFNELKGLETLINKNTAAVIVEPVQGEAGVYEATIDFLKKIREVTSENEVLLIIDEVQSGVGRTGSLYSYMNYDIAPDILTSAKGLGGGIPIGATLTTEAIGKSMRSEEDIVSTCLLYVENPVSTCLPSTDPKKLFQLSEKDGYHDSPTLFFDYISEFLRYFHAITSPGELENSKL